MNNTQFPILMSAFCGMVEAQQKERLAAQGYTPGLHNVQVTAKTGQKFVAVNVGTSGKFMVEIATGNIFGIKGLGQVHRGHFYGTLETVSEYFWGDYYPSRRDGKLKKQKANGCPVITKAPPRLLPEQAAAATQVMMDLAPNVTSHDKFLATMRRLHPTPATTVAHSTLATVAADVDTVCPDGPACDDPKCQAERVKRGLVTA